MKSVLRDQGVIDWPSDGLSVTALVDEDSLPLPDGSVDSVLLIHALEMSPRPQALLAYLESLGETRETPARIVLPGHGEPITDHVALIDERLAKTERRKQKFLNLILSIAYPALTGIQVINPR